MSGCLARARRSLPVGRGPTDELCAGRGGDGRGGTGSDPSQRSRTARSIVRAVRGTNGMTAGFLPFPRIRRMRCPRSTPRSSLLVEQASEARRPFNRAGPPTRRGRWSWRSASKKGSTSGSEQPVHPATLRGVNFVGSADVLGRVRRHPDHRCLSKTVEAAHRRRGTPVDSPTPPVLCSSSQRRYSSSIWESRRLNLDEADRHQHQIEVAAEGRGGRRRSVRLLSRAQERCRSEIGQGRRAKSGSGRPGWSSRNSIDTGTWRDPPDPWENPAKPTTSTRLATGGDDQGTEGRGRFGDTAAKATQLPDHEQSKEVGVVVISGGLRTARIISWGVTDQGIPTA